MEQDKLITNALKLIKAKQGISTDVRDEYLTAIISGLKEELENLNGIELEDDRQDHLMFLVDYANYRYDNRDDERMPNHLRLRFNNLWVDNNGK